jgi:imidazolonepropionase-like amidohydrolase
MLGLDDRVGALAPGRDADFVLWTQDPLELDARASRVFVDGREVFRYDEESGLGDVADPWGPTRIAQPSAR